MKGNTLPSKILMGVIFGMIMVFSINSLTFNIFDSSNVDYDNSTMVSLTNSSSFNQVESTTENIKNKAQGSELTTTSILGLPFELTQLAFEILKLTLATLNLSTTWITGISTAFGIPTFVGGLIAMLATLWIVFSFAAAIHKGGI